VTLWDKGYDVNDLVLKFTVGNDFVLDKKLVKFDCLASIAHAKSLEKIGVLTKQDYKKIVDCLNEIDELKISVEDEDCHTAIENYLVSKLGEVGKKIHTARSRNDQVLTAMRLYEKSELELIKKLVLKFAELITNKIAKHGKVPIPGYTHMQKAMPTTIGTWLGCFLDSSTDNLALIESVLKLVDQNPLGSGAGFGIPVFDIDKESTAKDMGFEKVMKNPIYCQHSRGKFEGAILGVLGQIMFDLNKLASDLILFNMNEFGYISLPKEFCTGSSIMPQKKNPDILELVRAKYHTVLGEEFKVKSLIGNLISGYNRDLQETKEPVMKSIDICKSCLQIMSLVVDGMNVNEDICKEAMTPELYATKDAYELVKKGATFRDAYGEIGKKYISK